MALTTSGYLRGVGQAILFGAIASSALVLGALAGWATPAPEGVLAAMLSFAAGALITALTFEMFETPTSKEAFGERHSALLTHVNLPGWLDSLTHPKMPAWLASC